MFSTAMRVQIKSLFPAVAVFCFFVSHAEAVTLRNIVEIECSWCEEKYKDSGACIESVDHQLPRWNSDGTMLAFLEISRSQKTLVVVRIDRKPDRFNFPIVWWYPDFPPKKEEKKTPPKYALQSSDRGEVSMFRWAPDQPDLILFQYNNRLYYAHLEGDRDPKPFELPQAFREYPKWHRDGKEIIYGESGRIFSAFVNSNRALRVIDKEVGVKNSNPQYFSHSSKKLIFERDEVNEGVGLYYFEKGKDGSVKVVDPGVSNEILPSFSPNNTYMAFVSDHWSAGKSGTELNRLDRPLDFYQTRDWRLYAVSADKAAWPVPIDRWLPVSGDMTVLLDFRYGLPTLCWLRDDLMLYLQKASPDRTESELWLARLPDNRREPVSIENKDSIGDSTLHYLNEIIYTAKEKLIAFSAYRHGNEIIAKHRKYKKCLKGHNRIFIGTIDGL